MIGGFPDLVAIALGAALLSVLLEDWMDHDGPKK